MRKGPIYPGLALTAWTFLSDSLGYGNCTSAILQVVSAASPNRYAQKEAALVNSVGPEKP